MRWHEFLSPFAWRIPNRVPARRPSNCELPLATAVGRFPSNAESVAAAAHTRDINRQRKTEARAQEYAERKRVARLAQVEKDITELEAKLKRIGQQIQEASNGQAFEKIKNLSLEYTAVESQLERKLQEWEDLAHE